MHWHGTQLRAILCQGPVLRAADESCHGIMAVQCLHNQSVPSPCPTRIRISVQHQHQEALPALPLHLLPAFNWLRHALRDASTAVLKPTSVSDEAPDPSISSPSASAGPGLAGLLAALVGHACSRGLSLEVCSSGSCLASSCRAACRAARAAAGLSRAQQEGRVLAQVLPACVVHAWHATCVEPAAVHCRRVCS